MQSIGKQTSLFSKISLVKLRIFKPFISFFFLGFRFLFLNSQKFNLTLFSEGYLLHDLPKRVELSILKYFLCKVIVFFIEKKFVR